MSAGLQPAAVMLALLAFMQMVQIFGGTRREAQSLSISNAHEPCGGAGPGPGGGPGGGGGSPHH